jgi:hypothetical protein
MMKFIDGALALVGLGRMADMVAWTKLMRSRVARLTEQRDAFEEKAYDLHFRCEHSKEVMKAECEMAMQAARDMHLQTLDSLRIHATSEMLRIHNEYAKRGLDKRSMDVQAAVQLEMDGLRVDLERELAEHRASNDRVKIKLLETEKSYSQLRESYQTARKKADMLEAREGSWQKLHGEAVRERNTAMSALENSLKNTANT